MKYEYLTLQSFFHSRPGNFNVYKPTIPGSVGNGSSSINAANLNDAMVKLGKEGWMLVSTTQTSSEGLLLFFRRELR